ncbi:MAG: glycosyltransferase, partial [Chitinophagaceae bacterium]
MNFPKISIVVPSYNQGQYLQETLDSIINQQYPGLELFVADGGSTDDSIDIIRKYENHINWWVSEKDRGQSDAINKGLRKVTGDIVTWINSDDMLTPGSLKKVADYFSKQPADVGLIHGGTTLFKSGKEILNDWGYKNPSLERNLAGMAFSQPSAFFLKKYLDKVGGQVNEQLHYGMDYDLFSRLTCVCRFISVKDIFSKYRLHDNSKSVTEQHRFIDDWNKTFVNLCRNLGWTEVVEEMKSTGAVEEGVFNYQYSFNFLPDKNIINAADRTKILFYHFCYILKALYWNDQMDKARTLLKYLRVHYPVA